MRKTFAIVLVLFCASLYATSLETMRKYYFDVNTEKIDLDDYEAFLEKNTSNNSAEWEGYRIMTWFLKAKDYYNPMSKLEAFQKEKANLIVL